MYILYLVYDCKVTNEDWDTLLLNKMYVIHNRELKVEYIFCNFIHQQKWWRSLLFKWKND